MTIKNIHNMYIISLLTVVGVTLAAPSLDGRIVGGTDAVDGEFPYVVSLQTDTGRHKCGGSILNKNHILTAAHCVDGKPQNLAIQYGTVDITSLKNKIAVKKVSVHSAYSQANNYANDVAVLKLESDIELGPNAKPVKLPTSSDVPAGNVDAVLIGWGRDWDDGQVQTTLKKVNYTKFSDKYCKSTDYRYNPNYQVCAGILGGGKGQCRGDSGGPLTINGVQYGIVSWSVKPCANAKHPGILTSVAKYVDWIQNKLQD